MVTPLIIQLEVEDVGATMRVRYLLNGHEFDEYWPGTRWEDDATYYATERLGKALRKLMNQGKDN